MSLWKPLAFVLVQVILLGSSVVGHEPRQSVESTPGEASVPLYTDLGDLTYPVTTKSERAQRYFDQGLRLTYAFNHAEARRSFREAQRQDPDCALCYWGEAFVLGPNINAPMDETAGNPAITAISQATQLAHHARAHEQALINALAKRYSDTGNTDRVGLNLVYAAAMEEAAKRFPKHDEIVVLYVDALMNLSPWDYWEADGQTPKGRIGEAIQIVESVLARHPNHPGAIHLYIHLTEASTTPERAEPYANRLAALMPGAGHIVHMGSHIFFRVGRYRDSAETNKVAVQADEAYLAGVEAEGIYPYLYYPHNIHFVFASAQMAGDAKTALEYAKRLEGKIPDAMAQKVGIAQRIKSTRYFAHAQLSTPDTVLALPDPGDKFPLVQAMWHYARGVACAAKRDVEGARSEAASIAHLNQTSDFRSLIGWGVPAPDLLRLARHVVEARIAQAEGNIEQTIREFRVAVAIQDALPYMEPPYWYAPVRQSLGAVLLEAGKAQEAEQVFQQSLEQAPKNGWALYGLMRAQQAQGKAAAARETEKRFKEAWAGDPNTLTLGRL